MTTTTLKITGMTCGHCEAAVMKALKNAMGVSSATVDLKAGRATVQYDEAQTTSAALATAVMNEGYTAEELE